VRGDEDEIKDLVEEWRCMIAVFLMESKRSVGLSDIGSSVPRPPRIPSSVKLIFIMKSDPLNRFIIKGDGNSAKARYNMQTDPEQEALWVGKWREDVALFLAKQQWSVPSVGLHEIGAHVSRPFFLPSRVKLLETLQSDPLQRFVISGNGNETRVMVRNFRGDEPEIEEFVEEWRLLIVNYLLSKSAMLNVSMPLLVGLSEIGANVQRPPGVPSSVKLIDVMRTDPVNRFVIKGEGNALRAKLNPACRMFFPNAPKHLRDSNVTLIGEPNYMLAPQQMDGDHSRMAPPSGMNMGMNRMMPGPNGNPMSRGPIIIGEGMSSLGVGGARTSSGVYIPPGTTEWVAPDRSDLLAPPPSRSFNPRAGQSGLPGPSRNMDMHGNMTGMSGMSGMRIGDNLPLRDMNGTGNGNGYGAMHLNQPSDYGMDGLHDPSGRFYSGSGMQSQAQAQAQQRFSRNQNQPMNMNMNMNMPGSLAPNNLLPQQRNKRTVSAGNNSCNVGNGSNGNGNGNGGFEDQHMGFARSNMSPPNELDDYAQDQSYNFRGDFNSTLLSSGSGGGANHQGKGIRRDMGMSYDTATGVHDRYAHQMSQNQNQNHLNKTMAMLPNPNHYGGLTAPSSRLSNSAHGGNLLGSHPLPLPQPQPPLSHSFSERNNNAMGATASYDREREREFDVYAAATAAAGIDNQTRRTRK
jgi:hypothetical protein